MLDQYIICTTSTMFVVYPHWSDPYLVANQGEASIITDTLERAQDMLNYCENALKVSLVLKKVVITKTVTLVDIEQ